MRKRQATCILLGLCPIAMLAQERADSVTHVLKDVEITTRVSKKDVVSTAPLRGFDAMTMQKVGITSVSDALHRLPGVTLRDYGGAGGLKTVSVRGFGASHTGVSYDGIPLSNIQSGQIDISRYSVDNVANLSLVVGDNADIFMPARAASSSASVSINTMKGNGEPELEAQLKMGSFGLASPFVKASMPVSDNVELGVIAEYTHADNDYPFDLENGDVTTREKRNNSRMNSIHAETNLFWRWGGNSTLFAKAYYYDNNRRLPGPVIYYNSINNEKLIERNAFLQTNFRTRLSQKVSWMVLGKFNFASSLYSDENGKYPGGMLRQNYYQREYYVSSSLLWQYTDQLQFDYSADYFFNNLNSNLTTDTRPYRHSILQSVSGKYSKGMLTAMTRLLYSIYLNGAEAGDGAKNANRLSPSVSLSLQPLKGHQFYVRASYKNIFRMPTFNEAYFDHYGSITLKPEITDQTNLGFTYSKTTQSILSAYTITLDGYVNHVKDMIVAVPYNMFIWNMTNLGKVMVCGIDATVSASLTLAKGHSLFVNSNYGFLRAMPRTSPESNDWMKQVAYMPRHSCSAAISYENPYVNMSLQMTGVGERFTTNANLATTRIDGYVELGASLWRSFALKGHSLEVRCDMLNLLDKNYCIVARYPMPGRHWQAAVKFKF